MELKVYYFMAQRCQKAGFMLSLENLENRPFSQKSGKIWNSQGVFYNIHPSQEKSGKTNYFVSISLSITIGLVVREVVALFVVSKCEFFTKHCEKASIVCITYL